MKKVSIAVGWDGSGKPQVLAVADRASLVLPALQKLPEGVVEAAVFKDPVPFKRRRLATPPTVAAAPQPAAVESATEEDAAESEESPKKKAGKAKKSS